MVTCSLLRQPSCPSEQPTSPLSAVMVQGQPVQLPVQPTQATGLKYDAVLAGGRQLPSGGIVQVQVAAEVARAGRIVGGEVVTVQPLPGPGGDGPVRAEVICQDRDGDPNAKQNRQDNQEPFVIYSFRHRIPRVDDDSYYTHSILHYKWLFSWSLYHRRLVSFRNWRNKAFLATGMRSQSELVPASIKPVCMPGQVL